MAGGGFEFTVKAQGLDKVLGNFQRLPKEMRVAVKQAVQYGLNDIASQGKLNARPPSGPKVRTGRYWNSIGGAVSIGGINEVKIMGAEIIGRVGTNVVYAPHLEFGTRPHTIVPRKAKALSWVSAGGQRVFAAIVHHPGSRAFHVLENAARTKADSVVRRIADAVGALIRKM
jgi:hypothetical protein